VGDASHRSSIDAVVDAEPVEEPQQVLGGDVARCSWGVGASTQATGRRVHLVHTGGQGGHRVGYGLAVRVVEVDSDSLDRDPLEDLAEETLHMRRGGLSDRLAQKDFLDSPLGQGLGEVRHPVGILFPFEGAVGGRGDVGPEGERLRALQNDSSDPMHRLVDCGVQISFTEGV
jgi:hypothetical protein